MKFSATLDASYPVDADDEDINNEPKNAQPSAQCSRQTYRDLKNDSVSSVKASRRFKIAVIASYAFLISLFSAVVYIADQLDPRFPF
jgi:hypothetical protein